MTIKKILTTTFSIILMGLLTGCGGKAVSMDTLLTPATTTQYTITQAHSTTTNTTTTTTTTMTTTTTITTEQNVQLVPQWRTQNLKAGTVVVKDPYNPGKWIYGVTGIQVCHTYGESCIIESLGIYGAHHVIVTVGFTDYDFYNENPAENIRHIYPDEWYDLSVYVDSYAEAMTTDGYFVVEPVIEIYDATRKLVLKDYGTVGGVGLTADNTAIVVWENISGSHEYRLSQGETLKISDPAYDAELHYPKVDAAIEEGRQNNWGLG